MDKHVILVTGISSGFGEGAAKALAVAGHTVYASMRETQGKNARVVEAFAAWAKDKGADLRTVELDVQSESSVEQAVATVRDTLLEPVYQELDRRGAVLFIHPTSLTCACAQWSPRGDRPADLSLGYPGPMLEFMFETTRTVTQMVLSGTLSRYPRMRILVPHAGACLPVLAGRIQLLKNAGPEPQAEAPEDVRASLMEALEARYVELMAAPEHLAQARAWRPIHERQVFGRSVLLFDGIERSRLALMGELHTPSIADLFVAMMGGPADRRGAAA